MRNPVLLKKIIEKTFKLNYNKKLKQTLIDLQENHGHTQVDTLINDWLPKVTAKYDHYYSLLTVDQYKEDLEWFKKEYLRDDVVEYLKGITYGLIEEGPPEDSLKNYVVCHNDIQECNILSMRHHSSDLAIIDYEYASLGNREFDLANTFCEMIEDNAYPYFPYIALYLENCPTQEEFEEYSKYYLELYHESFGAPEETKEEYVARELPQFLENLYCCMVFDGYFWGIWSILMIEEDKINDKIFNFSLGVLRMKITHHLLTLDFVKEAVDNKIRKYKASQE